MLNSTAAVILPAAVEPSMTGISRGEWRAVARTSRPNPRWLSADGRFGSGSSATSLLHGQRQFDTIPASSMMASAVRVGFSTVFCRGPLKTPTRYVAPQTPDRSRLGTWSCSRALVPFAAWPASAPPSEDRWKPGPVTPSFRIRPLCCWQTLSGNKAQIENGPPNTCLA
jgi:hypothetical protein